MHEHKKPHVHQHSSSRCFLFCWVGFWLLCGTTWAIPSRLVMQSPPAPVIVQPVLDTDAFVQVGAQKARTMIEVLAEGRVIGKRQCSGGQTTIPIESRALHQGEVLTARATLDGAVSAESLPAEVQVDTDVSPPETPMVLYIGSECVFVSGIPMRGSVVTVESNGKPVGEATTSERSAFVTLQRPLEASDAITFLVESSSRYLGNLQSRSPVPIVPVFPTADTSREDGVLPPVLITPVPHECQSLVNISQMTSGAQIEIRSNAYETENGGEVIKFEDEQLALRCAPVGGGILGLSRALFETGFRGFGGPDPTPHVRRDRLSARASFPAIGVVGQWGPTTRVESKESLKPPKFSGSLGAGERIVELVGVIPQSTVQLLRNGGPEIWEVDAENANSVQIGAEPALVEGEELRARQGLCGHWSAWESVQVIESPDKLDPPTILPPLVECMRQVNLTDRHPLATVEVYVVSPGLGVVTGDPAQHVFLGSERGSRVDVPPLTKGWHIYARQRIGGVVSAESNVVVVGALAPLKAPEIENQTHPGRLTVHNVTPGARVGVFWGNLEIGSTWSNKSTMEIPLRVITSPGASLRARQIACGSLGPWSNTSQATPTVFLTAIYGSAKGCGEFYPPEGFGFRFGRIPTFSLWVTDAARSVPWPLNSSHSFSISTQPAASLLNSGLKFQQAGTDVYADSASMTLDAYTSRARLSAEVLGVGVANVTLGTPPNFRIWSVSDGEYRPDSQFVVQGMATIEFTHDEVADGDEVDAEVCFDPPLNSSIATYAQGQMTVGLCGAGLVQRLDNQMLEPLCNDTSFTIDYQPRLSQGSSRTLEVFLDQPNLLTTRNGTFPAFRTPFTGERLTVTGVDRVIVEQDGLGHRSDGENNDEEQGPGDPKAKGVRFISMSVSQSPMSSSSNSMQTKFVSTTTPVAGILGVSAHRGVYTTTIVGSDLSMQVSESAAIEGTGLGFSPGGLVGVEVQRPPTASLVTRPFGNLDLRLYNLGLKSQNSQSFAGETTSKTAAWIHTRTFHALFNQTYDIRFGANDSIVALFSKHKTQSETASTWTHIWLYNLAKEKGLGTATIENVAPSEIDVEMIEGNTKVRVKHKSSNWERTYSAQ